MSKDKILLFLGAGFSREAFLPTMNEFGEFSQAQLLGSTRFDGIKNKKNYNSYSILKRSGEISEGFRRYCKKIKENYPFDDNNMEHLFSLAEMMDKCGYDHLSMDITNIETNEKKTEEISTKDLLKSIKIWLWQIYRRIPLNKPSKWGVKREPYVRFIDIIREYGFDNITVLTTNYDMILEYLCSIKGFEVKVYYGIKDNLKYKNVCKQANLYNFYNEEESQGNLCLYKLHGSVNFFEKQEDPSDTERSLYIIPHTGGTSGGSNLKNNRLPSITALDSIYELYSKKKKLIPSIIPPTYAKMQDYNWLKSIWNHSANALSSSNKWIFIGYSFPPSDGHMKSLINLSLIKRNNIPRVLVVAPEKDKKDKCQIKTNYKQVFGDNFEFLGKEFSEFIMDGSFDKELKNQRS